MSKPRTYAHVQERLDKDWGWRIVEISSLKKGSGRGSGAGRDAATRSLIALSYAHWEGFIKSASILYADHISLQGLTYGQALPCLSGFSALEHTQTMEGIKRKLFTATRLLTAIRDIDTLPLRVDLSVRLDRIGNLNFELFSEITEFFGFELGKYETRKQFIDESLLERRNAVAHGEHLDLNDIQAITIADETLTVMKMFKDDVALGASNRTYRR